MFSAAKYNENEVNSQKKRVLKHIQKNKIYLQYTSNSAVGKKHLKWDEKGGKKLKIKRIFEEMLDACNDLKILNNPCFPYSFEMSPFIICYILPQIYFWTHPTNLFMVLFNNLEFKYPPIIFLFQYSLKYFSMWTSEAIATLWRFWLKLQWLYVLRNLPLYNVFLSLSCFLLYILIKNQNDLKLGAY